MKSMFVGLAARPLVWCCLLTTMILLAIVDPTWAAVAFRAAAGNSVQSGTASFVSWCTASAGSGGETSLTLSTSSGNCNNNPSAGDLLIAQVAVRGSPSITTPTGWTLIRSTATGNIIEASYWRVATSSSLTSTWTFSSSERAIGGIAAFRNVDTVNPIDASGGQATTSSATVTAPTQAQASNNSMLVALFTTANGNSAFSTATSMTEAYDTGSSAGPNGVAISLNYQLDTSSGSTGSKISTTTSADNVGQLIVLSPSSGNLSIAVPTGTVLGDVMVASVAYRDRLLTIGTRSGWTQVNTSTQNNGGTNGMNLTTYYRVATGSEPASYNWTFSGGTFAGGTFEFAAGGISSFSGVDTTAPINAQAAQTAGNGSTYSFATPSITPSVNGAMLVGSFAFMNGDSWTPPATFTEAVDVFTPIGGNQTGLGFEMAYKLQTIAAAVSATATANNTYPSGYGVTQLLALKPSTSALDHYELSLPATSITCLPTTVTVTACADSSSPCTSAYATASGTAAALATSAGTLGAGTVTFNSTGVATTTLSFPTASSTTAVAVTLSGEQVTATNARQCCANGTTCSAANSCSTTFNTAGFIVASAANGAATTVPTQTAGTSSGTFYLRAAQTNTTTKACDAALTGTTTVNWAYQCNNPTTCSSSNLMSLNGGTATTIQRNDNASVSSYTAASMTFDANGNAPFTFNFSDVGQVTLWATKTVNSATLSGSSNAFVTKPAGFVLSGIKQTASPQLVNPAASSSTGAKFVKAGESFTATVTATTSGGVATPNYGKETSPEGVLLTQSLVVPSGANAGALSNATIAGGSFASGIATVTNLAWSEVGIITLTPGVGDASYLGTGEVTGTVTGNVGRFYPDHFTMLAGSTSTPYCGTAAAGFTYMGQPALGLAFTIEARNVQDALTTNYRSGGYNVGTVGFVAENADSGTDLGARLSGLPAPTWSSGSYAVNASGITFTRPSSGTTTDGPFDSLVVGVTVSDPDSAVLANRDMNASSVGCGAGCTAKAVNSTATRVRFGRLRIANALGSPVLALPVTLSTEYWNGTGFIVNAQDNCTRLTNTNIAFSNYLSALANCNTSGSPSGANGITFSGGRASSYKLSAPGAGHAGSVDLTVNLNATASGTSCSGGTSVANTPASLAWLLGNWGATTYNQVPTGRAAFGRYTNTPDIIYRRENY